MIKIIKVSEKGQIAIPQQIREDLGIEQGDELIITPLNDKILIEKAERIEKRLKDDFKDILKFNEQSLKEVWDNEEDKIWSRYLK